MIRVVAALTLSSFLLNVGGAPGCRTRQSAALPSETPGRDNSDGDIIILAEGLHSAIVNPFIAVILDAETYAALVKLEGNLPNLDAEFFNSKVIVAAFLGERNTGGYSVEITREANGGIRVAEKKPGKDVMVPQMITSPFKIVSFSTTERSLVSTSHTFADIWYRQMKDYRVSSGRFSMSGGIAGRVEEFGLQGHVRVGRAGHLATFMFALENAGESNEHSLFGFGTGITESNGAVTIYKLSAMSLVNQPNSGLKARGQFADNERKLSLRFTSLPSMIADGYSGMGTIEAEAPVTMPKP